MTRFGAGVLATLLVLTAVGLQWTTVLTSIFARAPEGSDHASGPGRFAVAGCPYVVGRGLGFAFESTVVARGSEGEVLASPDRFSGVLSLRAVRVGGGRAELEAALSGVELSQGMAKPGTEIAHGLTDGFGLDVSSQDCRILAFRLPEAWSASGQRLVANLLRGHEYVLGTGTTWASEQQDGMGPHRASYERRTDGGIVRRKLFYRQEGLETFGLVIELVASEHIARFGLDGLLTRSTGHERVRLKSGGALAADLEEISSLRRDDALFRAPSLGAIARVDPFAPAEDGAGRLPDAPADLDEARMRFESALAGLEGMSVADARRLAGLLAAHSALVGALAERLHEWSEDQRASAFWALELAATDAAKAVLTELLDAPMPNDRIRATIALSGAGEPTVEVGQALVDLHARATEPRLATAALLAVGSLASEGDEAVRGLVRETLGAALSEAISGAETRAALDAVGNAGDPALLGPVSEAMLDEDPRTRAHAADALRRMGAPASALLQAALEDEKDREAALAMARSLREIGPPNAASVAWAEGQLGRSNPDTRAELIRWLGASASPEARAALARRFRVETSGPLKQLIGRFLPPSALAR